MLGVDRGAGGMALVLMMEHVDDVSTVLGSGDENLTEVS